MKTVTLRVYKNRVWQVAEVYENGVLVDTINLFYKVDDNYIYIYETDGGSGTGYRPGNLLRKISLEGGNFKTEFI